MTIKPLLRIGAWGSVWALVTWLGIIPLRLALAARQVPHPQAVLVLGGGTGREAAASQLAKADSALEVWVSTGKTPQETYPIFQADGVMLERVHLDYQATDTVTNFTTLAPYFKQQGIQHIYVVTSDYHMSRATVIGALVLGHHDIAFTAWSVPSEEPAESWLKTVRDGGRSLLWIVTGHTGSRLGQRLQEQFTDQPI